MSTSMANPLMNREQLDGELDRCLSFARGLIAEHKMEDFTPCAFLKMYTVPEQEPGTMNLCYFANFDTEKRFDILYGFGRKLGMDGALVLAMVFLSQGHAAVFPDMETTKPSDYPRASEVEGNREAIVAMGMTIDGIAAINFCYVTRGPDNEMLTEEPVNRMFDPDEESSSPLLESFFSGYHAGVSMKLAGDILENMKNPNPSGLGSVNFIYDN